VSTETRWFLHPDERGNPATGIDRGPDGAAWSEGNEVSALVHGRAYFARLASELRELRAGDLVFFTDWRGDADERLDGQGSELGTLLAGVVRSGVDVRGLVWRSHPDQEEFSEQENVHLGRVVNDAGGEVLLDERVRRMGSHHQKLVLVRHRGREELDVAFVGGIDLCHGRHDDEHHQGDPQVIRIDRRYGPTPAWHDVQLEIRGPAVGALSETFRERWDDPTPLDHRSPWSAWMRRVGREPRRARPLPPIPAVPSPCGPHAVQVLRTYPDRRPRYPFAPHGERSVARAYGKALSRARSLIYIEDQYLWSSEIAALLADAVRRSPELRLIVVVPRHPDRDGALSGPPYRVGQQEAVRTVLEAGSDRVAVYDLENEDGWPIYVHAKVCVIDDVWAAVGSDNLNRRSWTHDSELSCAVLDSRRDRRVPIDPAGRGDGARSFARDLRLQLWREHLGPGVAEEDLLDPGRGFEAWRRSARALDAWHGNGRRAPRPPGRVRAHDVPSVPRWAAWWARPLYRMVVDPDGRPRSLKRAGRF
jgi:phosphatidylserine/phosphatidylglycerophosphate/cardiolipin synthase-like enzyme